MFELTPAIVGPSITRNAGIIGQSVDLSLEHIRDLRRSTLLFHLTQQLLYTKWCDPGDEPKLHLFGQLKRITPLRDRQPPLPAQFTTKSPFSSGTPIFSGRAIPTNP